jgi:hypothetical protein
LKSIDELVEFFDKHDVGDYWDRLPKAGFEDQNPKTPRRDRREIILSINQIARSAYWLIPSAAGCDALDLSEFENVEVSPGEITITPLGISPEQLPLGLEPWNVWNDWNDHFPRRTRRTDACNCQQKTSRTPEPRCLEKKSPAPNS